MKIKFNFLGLFLSVGIACLLNFVFYTKDKVFVIRDFIVDCITNTLVLPKTKFPILLSRSQSAMRSYYKIFGRFTGSAVVNIPGHFIAKKSVNTIA